MRILKFLAFALIIIQLSACNLGDLSQNFLQSTDDQRIVNTVITPTPLQPENMNPIVDRTVKLWIPEYFSDDQIVWKNDSYITKAEEKSNADCYINAENEGIHAGDMVFALVAPFNTTTDEITIAEFENLFFPAENKNSQKRLIFLSEKSHLILSEVLGKLPNWIIIVPENEIFEHVANQSDAFGIIGFDQLEPKWKVLDIAEISPFDKEFDLKNYRLTIPVAITCKDSQTEKRLDANILNKFSNRKEEKITSVLLTGTTALTRATGYRMEKNGNDYPGEKIKIWFENSDLTHISSETPFYNDCPYPDPYQKNLIFCSHPDYLELFTYLEVDVIELTGNHLLDRGVSPFENTLDLFQKNDLTYYAGGFSKQEAASPVLIEHNGNKIAFLGCNIAGPPNVWATEDRAGVNLCDIDELNQQIFDLINEDYLPIVTFQFYELSTMRPSSSQIDYFRAIIDAGAVIVSGSQSHVPMTMENYKNGFIHYGLGNLFFDQMQSVNNRREFLDRHIFYEGRYIGTELLTAMLENYAQPRPMTSKERTKLLLDAFELYTLVDE